VDRSAACPGVTCALALGLLTGDRGQKVVRQLREEGYVVTYREFEGGHAVPDAIAREAFAWLS